MPRTIVKQVKNARLYDDGTILVQNVRFSYPHLAEAWAKDPEKEKKKFSVKGLAPKSTHREAKDLIKGVMDDMLKDNKVAKMASKDKFLRDGDQGSKVEEEGMYTISASETKRPSVRGPNTQPIPIDEIEDRVRPGYWGDMLIRPWFQNNKHGTKINAGLVAVQLKKKDEEFGEGRISEDEIDETFDAVDEDEDDISGFDNDDDDDL